jgi:hypothetical protein
MTTFGVWRWNDAKGGMRFAFPPYGPTKNSEDLANISPYRWCGKNSRYDLAGELGLWGMIQGYYRQKDRGGFHYRRPLFSGQAFRSARTDFIAFSLPARFLMFPNQRFRRLSLPGKVVKNWWRRRLACAD